MKTCTFFGHRDAPSDIRDKLKSTLTELIEKEGVTLFYVGHNGKFDSLVRSVLEELSAVYEEVEYYTVLAYLPTEKDERVPERTLYPEGLENVPKRFAIDKRNHWMLGEADYAVTYVQKSFGGAEKFKALAERKNIKVTELHEERGIKHDV